MAITAREYLMFVRESSYGVPDLTAGAPTTGAFGYLRLDQGNAFTVRPNVATIDVPYGGGVPIPAIRIPGAIAMRGKLTTLLSYAQAATLLPWAITNVNVGRSAPWTTSDAAGLMPVGDMASLSFYHAIRAQDGTYIKRAYRSCKVLSLELSCSSDQPLVRVAFEVLCGKPIPHDHLDGDAGDQIGASEFPDPTDSSYPTDIVHYFHSRGNLSFFSATRTMYDNLTLSFQNQLASYYFEYQWPQLVTWFGRTTRVQFRSLYRSTPDDRSTYESNTAGAVTLQFSNAAHSVALNYNSKNWIDESPQDDLPLDQVYRQQISLKNYRDAAAGADVSVTVT